MQITINYVTKEDIFPAFGRAIYSTNTVEIREDLPQRAKDHLLVHEIYHLYDKPKQTYWGVIWGEVKANWAAASQEKIGFIIVLYLSVSSKARLKFYWDKYIMRK